MSNTLNPGEQTTVEALAAIQQTDAIQQAREDIEIEITPAEIEQAKLKAQKILEAKQRILANEAQGLTNQQMAQLTKNILATLANQRLLDMSPFAQHQSLREHVLQRHTYCSAQNASDADLVAQVQQLQPQQFTGSVLVLNNAAEEQAVFDAIASVAAELSQASDQELQQKCAVSCYFSYDTLVTEIKLPIAEYPKLNIFKTHKCFHPSVPAKSARMDQASVPVLKPTNCITIINKKIWHAAEQELSQNNVPSTIYPDAAEFKCQFTCEPGIIDKLKEQDQFTSLISNDCMLRYNKTRLLQQFQEREQREQEIMAAMPVYSATLQTGPKYSNWGFSAQATTVTKQYPNYVGGLKLVDAKYIYHGQGTLELDANTVYTGTFENGHITQGVLTVCDPKDPSKLSRYTGEFANEVCHGKGKLESDANTVYTGTFENGHITQGTLTLYNPANREQKLSVYEGSFQAGAMTQGVLTVYDPDNPGKSSQYTGEFVDDMFHGNGKMIYSNGEIYEGEWQEGMRHGMGQMFYQNGVSYRGNWQYDKKHSLVLMPDGGYAAGVGTIIYPISSANKIRLRQGIWVDDQEPKYQIIHYVNGSKYIGSVDNYGQFQEGVLTLKTPFGVTSYTGIWQDNHLFSGTVVYASGAKYQGEVRGLRRDGHGTLTDFTGQAYTGEWYKDGLREEVQPNNKYYDGGTKIVNGVVLRHGTGKATYANGSIYSGRWEEDVPLFMNFSKVVQPSNTEQAQLTAQAVGLTYNADVGYEALRYDTGTYYGEVCQQKPDGVGVMIYSNGSKYQGKWRNGMRHGKGKMLYANGTVCIGIWVDDRGIYEQILMRNKQMPEVCSYQGGFVNGSPHGQGSLCAYPVEVVGPSKDLLVKRYEGTWEHGNLINGTIEYYNGGKYTGAISAWCPGGTGTKVEFKHRGVVCKIEGGHGTMVFANGDIYTGVWPQSMFVNAFQHNPACHPCGFYDVTYANGNKFTGVIAPYGNDQGGVFTYPAGHKYKTFTITRHSCNDKKPALEGEIVYANGDRYIGRVFGNNYQGQVVPVEKGKFIYVNGDRYDGEINQGQPGGKGVFTYVNGDSYKGTFKNGQPDGDGVLTKINDDDTVTTITGVWQQGKLMSTITETTTNTLTAVASGLMK